MRIPRALLRAGWRGLRLIEHLAIGALLTLWVHRGEQTGRRDRENHALVRWWHRRLCRILHIKISIQGKPAPEGSLIAANHVSWLDIPVLGSLSDTAFLSKEEVRRWPLVGWLAASCGTLFIERGHHQSTLVTRQITERLEECQSVTLFPEGTTTEGAGVRHFFPRLFAAVVDTNTRVQPVALRYFHDQDLDPVVPFIGDESFSRHLGRMLFHPGSQAEVIFCSAFGTGEKSRREVAETARQAVLKALPSSPEAKTSEGLAACGCPGSAVTALASPAFPAHGNRGAKA